MPTPSEAFAAPPFAQLEDRLLRGGIAPRHVRRYLRELTEHLADLTAEQRAAGHDGADAAASARVALGTDVELANAMLEQPRLRALSVRAPWLVFGAMPPLALFLGYVLWLVTVITVGHLGGVIDAHRKMVLPIPGWFHWTMAAIVFATNFLLGTSLAFLLAGIAARQRVKLLWPLLGMALILVLGMCCSFHADGKGISITLTGLFSVYHYRTFGRPGFHIHWLTLLAQTALLGLPLAWLLRSRHRNISPQ